MKDSGVEIKDIETSRGPQYSSLATSGTLIATRQSHSYGAAWLRQIAALRYTCGGERVMEQDTKLEIEGHFQ